ncbi:MAG: PEP-CTERM sorting domain-containing protein [Phycisphaerae bacterium]
MLSEKFSQISTLAAKAAIASTALATLGVLAGAASANNVIYQDNFSGSSTLGTLNGAAPTVDNGTSATWTVATGTGFADSGYTSYSDGNGSSAYLNFKPVSGFVYTLSAGLNMISGLDSGTANSNNDWLAIGFLANPSSTARFDNGTASGPGAYAWASVRGPGFQNYGNVFGGPGTNGFGEGYANAGGASGGVNNISIVLNTGQNAWTFQVFDDGTSVSPVEVFPTNPAIIAVGLANNGSVTDGQFSNFELSSSPVPEPAALGLFGVGGGYLLMLKRRRRAV